MDSGECAGLSVPGRYVGMESISSRPVIILHTSNTFSRQSNPQLVKNETVISLNDFKLWDQLEMVPCSTRHQRKDGKVCQG